MNTPAPIPAAPCPGFQNTPGSQNAPVFQWTEPCGLSHGLQVVEIDLPLGEGLAEAVFPLVAEDGRVFFAQRSRREPGRAFVQVSVQPLETLTLRLADGAVADGSRTKPAVTFQPGPPERRGVGVLSNGLFALELFVGEEPGLPLPAFTPGPVRRVRLGDGPWRGGSADASTAASATFFDARQPVERVSGEWLELGALRAVYRFRAAFAGGGFYEATITVDDSQPWAHVAESFRAAASEGAGSPTGAQLVWDFSGADLPDAFCPLDGGAGMRVRPLGFDFDARLARLAAWTQQSQLLDFSDGFAVRFRPADDRDGNPDTLGFVTLRGGDWRGGNLNHLEAWTRRWLPGDPSTRRDLPADAKADSAPGADQAEARGAARHRAHFTVEGWIGHYGHERGRREFALVLAPWATVAPESWRGVENGVPSLTTPAEPGTPVGHFDDTLDRPAARRQQSLLRRIHIRHGLMPLQEQLSLDFAWAQEPPRPDAAEFSGGAADATDTPAGYPNLFLELHFSHWSREQRQLPGRAVFESAFAQEPGSPLVGYAHSGGLDNPLYRPDPQSAKALMLNYLAVRVQGFWDGSGLAFTNPVVGRRIAPCLFLYEWLAARGHLSPGEQRTARGHFAFLTHLFVSENCYPGDATMLTYGQPGGENSPEPTLRGMANQNFYTDVYNVPGTAAQIFHAHPQAALWRARFAQQWQRQLAFHVYPESGVWEESHTYYTHVLLTVLPTLWRRWRDGVDDAFAAPAFQRLAESALRQLTPRDACMGGRRYILPFGDHSPEPMPERFHALAVAFARANPALSRQLAQAAAEMEPATEARAETAARLPDQNEAVQGLGVFFRDTDATGLESLLALRSGPAWAHHHNDDGSLQFYAKGRALVIDSAFSLNQPGGLKVEAAGHSRWSLRDLQPVNYFWRFSRGCVTSRDLQAPAPWASVESPVRLVRGTVNAAEALPHPALHWRSVARLDATTFLVFDTARCEHAQVVRFHIASNEARWEGDRAVLDFPGGRFTLMPLAPLSASPATPILPLAQHAPESAGAHGFRDTARRTTTCAAFDTGTLPFTAWLLRAGEPGERVEVAPLHPVTAIDADGTHSTGPGCLLRVGGLEVEITHEPDRDRVVLNDRSASAAPRRTVVDLRTRA